METFMYTFSINAGNEMLKTNIPVTSPRFKTTFNGVSFSWQLQFCSKFKTNNEQPSLRLVGRCCDEPINAKVQFVIIPNEISNVECYSSGELNMNVRCRWYVYSRFSFTEKIPEEIKIFPDNCFKILCVITISRNSFNRNSFNRYLSENPGDDEKSEIVEFAIGENFILAKSASSNLFGQVVGDQPSDGLCDVILQSSDGTSFFCHKMILALSSAVFKTMFSRFDIKVNPENVKQSLVEIEDIDGETITEVLRYIYKKEFGPNVDNLLVCCLHAAEKYDLPELKAKCIATLKFNLTPDNVLDYLDLADRYSSESLKMGCFEILRLFDHMIDKEKLKMFSKNDNSIYPDMVAFLYKRFDTNLVM